MNILEHIRSNRLYLDGSMGTLLQWKGLEAGELPETWNISHPDAVLDIHRSYFDAGSNVVSTNTFGANTLKFSLEELDNIIGSATRLARRAAEESVGSQPKWVALDIGPTGRMLAPYGDLDFEDAVSVFAETVKLGVKHGVDIIFIETMNDCYETKAALLAAKENSSLPVFVSNAYSADGKLMTGASPEVMVAMLEAMGAEAVGVNCSLGPKALADVARKYLSLASVPVILKPNAGLPAIENGRTFYDITPCDFARQVEPLLQEGVGIVGGCCGTTPEYISYVVESAEKIPYSYPEFKSETVITSYTKAVRFGDAPILNGERINPKGKKRF